MTDPYRIPLSSRTIKALVIWQSILSGLAMVSGAGAFTTVVDPRWAGFLVVLATGAQQVIASLLAKSIGQAMETATVAVESAGAASASASIAARTAATEVASIHAEMGAERRRRPGGGTS